MPNQGEHATRRDLEPSEIIRLVKQRYRICNYLFNTGAFWMLAGVVIALLSANSKIDLPPEYSLLGMVLLMIGTAIFTAAFALTLAIYRCPVCDQYLSRFRPDKLRCPKCSSLVRLST